MTFTIGVTPAVVGGHGAIITYFPPSHTPSFTPKKLIRHYDFPQLFEMFPAFGVCNF